jgi:hypothetical protein
VKRWNGRLANLPLGADRPKRKAAEVLNLLMSSSFLKRRNQCLNQMGAPSAVKRAY